MWQGHVRSFKALLSHALDWGRRQSTRVLASRVFATAPRRIGLGAALVLLGLPSGLVFAEGLPGWITYPLRILLILLGFAVLGVHAFRWGTKPSQVFPAPPAPEVWERDYEKLAFNRHELQTAVGRDWRQLPIDTAVSFGKRLTSPTRYRTRVVEEVHVRERHLHRRVTVGFLLQAEECGQLVLLPYARPPKGAVLEGLVVRDSDGASVRTLSYRETGSLLGLLLYRGFDRLAPAAIAEEDEQWALVAIDRAIATHRTPDDTKNDVTSFERILGKTSSVVGADQMFFDVLKVAAERRPLVAAVSVPELPNGSTSILYEIEFEYVQRITGVTELTFKGKDNWENTKQAARKWIGAGANKLAIEASRGRSCLSYQLRVYPPDGCYFSDALLVDRTSGVIAPNMPHGERYSRFVSWSTERADPCSNLHTVNLGETAIYEPDYLVRLREVPPGTMSLAFGSAAVVLFMIWLCGSLFPGLPGARTNSSAAAASSNVASGGAPAASPSSNVASGGGLAASSPSSVKPPDSTDSSPQATDVVAFILGVPAVLGAWLSLAGGKRTYASLTARASLLASSVLAVAAAATYLFHVRHPGSAKPFPGGRNFMLITEMGWSVLFVFALANAAYITLALAIRVGRFRAHLSS